MAAPCAVAARGFLDERNVAGTEIDKDVVDADIREPSRK
jgi:hypothetical protein